MADSASYTININKNIALLIVAAATGLVLAIPMTIALTSALIKSEVAAAQSAQPAAQSNTIYVPSCADTSEMKSVSSSSSDDQSNDSDAAYGAYHVKSMPDVKNYYNQKNVSETHVKDSYNEVKIENEYEDSFNTEVNAHGSNVVVDNSTNVGNGDRENNQSKVEADTIIEDSFNDNTFKHEEDNSVHIEDVEIDIEHKQSHDRKPTYAVS